MIQELFGLEGKVALVTGGGKGIGAMITKGLIEAGAKVYISSRSAAACEAYANEMSQYGTCIALPADLSKMENIEGLVKELEQRESKLDILVNNSGASWGAPLGAFPEKGWDKVMDLNVKSLFFLTQGLLPLIKAGSSHDSPGRIINISSVASIMAGGLDAFSYSASKAAVTQLTRVLANKLTKDHVLVNAIGPGFFPSKMTAHIDDEQYVKEIPLRRLGTPSDIAGLTIFLCSKAGSYMTGTFIPIDGGLLIA